MDCCECRQHLHPYVDNELGVEENLRVLEHLEECPDCAGRYECEQALSERLKAASFSWCCPDRTRDRLLAALNPDAAPSAPSRNWRGTFVRVVAPLAAAAAVIAVFFVLRPTPPVKPADDSCDHPHGHMVSLLAAANDELAKHYGRNGRTRDAAAVLAALREGAVPDRPCECIECPTETLVLVREILNEESAELPCCETGFRPLGVRALSLSGVAVAHVFGLMGSSRVSLFILKRNDSIARNLDTMHCERGRALRGTECTACKLATFHRGECVYIVVTCDDYPEVRKAVLDSF